MMHPFGMADTVAETLVSSCLEFVDWLDKKVYLPHQQHQILLPSGLIASAAEAGVLPKTIKSSDCKSLK